MLNALRPVVGLVTIGQSPRPDIVPDMAAIIGPGVDILEAGALDGLTRSDVDALKPTGDDEILVTRLLDGTGVFVGVPDPFEATRYHSLVIRPDSVPDVLEVTAHTDDGTVMGVRHRDLPMEGVQFHPESILTSAGHDLLANFLAAL